LQTKEITYILEHGIFLSDSPVKGHWLQDAADANTINKSELDHAKEKIESLQRTIDRLKQLSEQVTSRRQRA